MRSTCFSSSTFARANAPNKPARDAWRKLLSANTSALDSRGRRAQGRLGHAGDLHEVLVGQKLKRTCRLRGVDVFYALLGPGRARLAHVLSGPPARRLGRISPRRRLRRRVKFSRSASPCDFGGFMRTSSRCRGLLSADPALGSSRPSAPRRTLGSGGGHSGLGPQTCCPTTTRVLERGARQPCAPNGRA